MAPPLSNCNFQHQEPLPPPFTKTPAFHSRVIPAAPHSSAPRATDQREHESLPPASQAPLVVLIVVDDEDPQQLLDELEVEDSDVDIYEVIGEGLGDEEETGDEDDWDDVEPKPPLRHRQPLPPRLTRAFQEWVKEVKDCDAQGVPRLYAEN